MDGIIRNQTESLAPASTTLTDLYILFSIIQSTTTVVTTANTSFFSSNLKPNIPHRSVTETPVVSVAETLPLALEYMCCWQFQVNLEQEMSSVMLTMGLQREVG
jgi:hypothetical protein